jgi:hypothetical protein
VSTLKELTEDAQVRIEEILRELQDETRRLVADVQFYIDEEEPTWRVRITLHKKPVRW